MAEPVPNSVERYIKEGVIPALKLPRGRRIYVKKADLLAALEPVESEDDARE
jgi:hypothetical protein